MKELQLRNRQRVLTIDLQLLREITRTVLDELLRFSNYQVAVHLISAPQMARLNQQFLQHPGSTDVITFDFRTGYDPEFESTDLAGEIYVCPAVAREQALEFGTTWQSELVRYVTHGILHLVGYDDLVPARRKVMKQQENRLVKALERRFDFRTLAA